MEKTVKEIVAAYALLKDAKVTKMDDTDKYALVRKLRTMRRTAGDLEEERTDALEKLKGEGHDAFVAKAQQWRREGADTTLTEEERAEVNKYFEEYDRKVRECLEAGEGKTVDVGAPLSEEAFGKLAASNDWTLGQMDAVAAALTED